MGQWLEDLRHCCQWNWDWGTLQAGVQHTWIYAGAWAFHRKHTTPRRAYPVASRWRLNVNREESSSQRPPARGVAGRPLQNMAKKAPELLTSSLGWTFGWRYYNSNQKATHLRLKPKQNWNFPFNAQSIQCKPPLFVGPAHPLGWQH